MIKTNSAQVICDPLDIAFDVIEKGGSAMQKKETSTGRYDPNREITPFVLMPNLQVKDPEQMIADGDYTSSLTNARWYVGSITEVNRIKSTTSGFELGDNGKLTVTKNSTPSNSEMLILVVAFIDPRRNEVMEFTKRIAIGCEAVNEVNASLEFDAPVRLPLSPFKNLTTRTINAQLFNGKNEVPDADAVYKWRVLTGVAWRDIDADDLFYVSGQNTKSLVIDRRYIDREVIRIEAYHVSLPTAVESAQTKVQRSYGQWEERCDILRGKAIHLGTTESEVTCNVANRQGNIANPQKYFDIAIAYRKVLAGENWRLMSHTPRAVIPISLAEVKYGVRVAYGVEVREKTALRPMRIGGEDILINGKIACIQVPKTESEL